MCYNISMDNINEYVYGRTSTYNLTYIIAWKSTRRLSHSQIDVLKLELNRIAIKNDIKIINIEIEKGMIIELLIKLKPKTSITNIISIIKGTTGKKLKTDSELSSIKNIWERKYFVESIGRINKQELKKFFGEV